MKKTMAVAASIFLVGGAAAVFACGEQDKTKSASASYAVSDDGGCASKTKAAVAKDASGCATKKGAQASFASTAGGDHCATKKANRSASFAGGDHCATSKNTVAGAECVYGDNTVAINGACPTANEADYALAVTGAQCRDTGAAVARAIKNVPGVAAVSVNFDEHVAYVCADGKKASAKNVVASLKKAGYKGVKVAGKGRTFCTKAHAKDEV